MGGITGGISDLWGWGKKTLGGLLGNSSVDISPGQTTVRVGNWSYTKNSSGTYVSGQAGAPPYEDALRQQNMFIMIGIGAVILLLVLKK